MEGEVGSGVEGTHDKLIDKDRTKGLIVVLELAVDVILLVLEFVLRLLGGHRGGEDAREGVRVANEQWELPRARRPKASEPTRSRGRHGNVTMRTRPLMILHSQPHTVK